MPNKQQDEGAKNYFDPFQTKDLLELRDANLNNLNSSDSKYSQESREKDINDALNF